MEEQKQLLSRWFLALEQAEPRLLHLKELLTVTRKERDEAREQLLKLVAEYCDMVTNTQQAVVMSIDQLEWPNTLPASADHNLEDYSTMHCDSSFHSPPEQFSRNSTFTNPFDLELGINLHRLPTSCSNLLESQEHPFYPQNEQPLGFIEQQQSEQLQHVESHFLGPPSVLSCTRAAMPAHQPEPPKDNFEVRRGTLPERGNLLEAVMQAGPLFETLHLTGPLPQWKHPPAPQDFVEILRISMSSSHNSRLPTGPLVHHVPSPEGPADRLQVNSAVSSSHHSVRPRTRTNKPPTAALVTCAQSGSAAASNSSKLLVAPVLNSLDSAFTRGRILNLPKMH